MKYTLDWNEYAKKARAAVAEGCVLIKNEDSALPISKKAKVAVFGRIQFHYYKSGTGSGGMVNVSHVISIPEGLEQAGIRQSEIEARFLQAKTDEETLTREIVAVETNVNSRPTLELVSVPSIVS